MHSSNQPSAHSTEAAKVVIIDNYDSFTYNIREALAKLGIDATVIRNDVNFEEFRVLNPSHIIVGPGPGTPDNPNDVGITFAAIDYAMQFGRSLLGVCLGHQAIAKHFGGSIEQAPEVKHGKTSTLMIHAKEQETANRFDLFQGLEADVPEVMRYHSLVASNKDFPREELDVTSSALDGGEATIMSLQHRKHPIFGVQFHPESFATSKGSRILENFLQSNPPAFEELKKRGFPEEIPVISSGELPSSLEQLIDSLPHVSFEIREFLCDLPPEEVYARLHGASEESYCLESLETHQGDRIGRFSYFGFCPSFVISARNKELFLDNQPLDTGDTSPMDVFQELIERFRAPADQKNVPEGQSLSGGFVGYLSYEAAQYREPQALSFLETPPNQKTFAFGYFPDGLTYDRATKKYFYYTRGADRSSLFHDALKNPAEEKRPSIHIKEYKPHGQFERSVQKVRDRDIRSGETFQTVLSHKNTYSVEGSMAPLYRNLRSICPSQNMHAIRIGESESMGSFPELTLRIQDGEATTYQLAGTIARTGSMNRDSEAFAHLISDPKERAEHMMLVDLARNDLSRHAAPGSVYLPEGLLMHRLDAGRVMHIASEVRSKIGKVSPVEVLLDVAPMGTVSGAPKIRSMKIIHEFEGGEPRGLYAGSFGFIDVRGNLEMVVGLRSLMRQGKTLTIQAGAGIVYDSQPEKEYMETMLKMQVALKTIQPFVS